MPRRRAYIALAALSLAAWSAAADVEIAGVDGEVLANVRLFVGNPPACAASEPAVARFAERLPERLQPALDAFGYYEAQVTTAIETGAGECWRLRVAIERGQPTLVRHLAVSLHGAAENDPPLRDLVAAFPLTIGGVLRHGAYLEFKRRLETLARERGYLEGRFVAERVEVHADRAAADIELAFDSGPRYAFGTVSFNTTALSDPVLQSFVGFAPGEPYDAALVARLQRDLSASGYFDATNVVADLDTAPELKIPIRIDATAGRPVRYSIGGGYSTDDGPRFRFLHENRRRNKEGHQMLTDVLLSTVRQSAAFDYRIPVGNPQRDLFTLRTGLERENLDAGTSSAVRLGGRRTRVSDERTLTQALELMYERDDAGGAQLETTLLLPGISWTQTLRDDLVRPREGRRLSLDLAAGLGSDLALLRTELAAKWITTTAWGARVLLRGRLGANLTEETIDRIPLSMRFFAGGDDSVRGYDFKSLGPRDADGELIGGNRLLDASIEYEHPVRRAWSVASFVDAGTARLADESADLSVGAGIGARWFSPLGPVRVDIAWPLDGDDRSPRLHISLGPDL